MSSKFNLELIDFRFTEICSFDPIEEEFSSNLQINPINPFKIVFLKKKSSIVISAYCDLEWLSLASVEGPFTMRKGQVKSLKTSIVDKKLRGSFRILLEKEKSEIFHHEWDIYQ